MFVNEYLQALEEADLPRVLALFAPDGVVHSPLYGTMPAVDFYPALFADTAESKLTLRSVLESKPGAAPITAFWFDFEWTLSDGTPAPFTVVDLAELDDEGLISALHIIYETAPIRSNFERSSGRKLP